MSTRATEPVKNILVEEPAPVESPALKAIATLRDVEQHLRAEAAFAASPAAHSMTATASSALPSGAGNLQRS